MRNVAGNSGASHITRSRNDPRGRGLRGALLPELPRYKTRSQRFDNSVIDAYEPFYEKFGALLGALDVAVDIVPRMRLSQGHETWPEDVVADGQVPLGRLVSAGVDREGHPTRPRLIVFRRPVEMRASTPVELEALLRHIVVRLLAVYLNTVPESIDSRFDWDFLD